VRYNELFESYNDDDELFGKDNDTRSTLRTLKRLRQSVEQDPQAHGIRDLLKNYNNENSTLEQRAAMTLEYMASTIGMTKEQFEAAAPDLMFAANFEYHRPWQLWDLKTIDKTIHFFQYALDHQGMNEDADDDELFGETTLIKRIEQLLSAKQKVFTRVPGAMGQVMSLNGDNLILKTRPHSTTRYSWGGLENNPDRFRLERNPADGRWYLVDAENPFNYRG
jgi:hypothetical protein